MMLRRVARHALPLALLVTWGCASATTPTPVKEPAPEPPALGAPTATEVGAASGPAASTLASCCAELDRERGRVEVQLAARVERTPEEQARLQDERIHLDLATKACSSELAKVPVDEAGGLGRVVAAAGADALSSAPACGPR